MAGCRRNVELPALVFLLNNEYSHENLKQFWEKQKEIWNNTLTLWQESWTICERRMLILVWIVYLLERSIRESSHWDF